MMDVVRINGGYSLNGEVEVSGAKNACLLMFAASLLTDEPCILENVPNLSDVRFMGQILEHMGVAIDRPNESTWQFHAKNLATKAPYDLVRKMRASVCLMGPMVARLRKAQVSLPGGCVIGQRPIDLHLKGLTRLGCKIKIEHGYVHIDAKNLQGNYVFLGGRHGSTVTGTANIIMAAVLASGVTQIDSAACEPEIEDLCRMLVAMGARIEGIGSHALRIEGVDRLHGCTHRVIGDRIEAGTFLVAAPMTGGSITVRGACVRHLGALLHKLEEAGVRIHVREDGSIQATGTPKDLKPIELITLPYPGFPTDLQAQMCALMSVTSGLSIVTEKIYPNRYMHVSELQRMGANISIEGNSAIIHGTASLSGAPMMASDLRASAALYLAALAAEGESWIQRIYHLDRGYDRFDEKLNKLGADIIRMKSSEMPKEIAEPELVSA